MDMVQLMAPAKLNLYLDIVGTRPDGYHLLQSIFQTVSIYDIISLQRAENIRLDCSDSNLPLGMDNLAYKAAALFLNKTGLDEGVCIHLEKHIPYGAGMGGGSSDAAAVLLGLNRLFSVGLSMKELADLAILLGADVPYFLHKGTALIEGIGEIIRPTSPLTQGCFLVVKPMFEISTAWAYQQFDAMNKIEKTSLKAMETALCNADLTLLSENLFNALEQAVHHEEIHSIKEKLLSVGALGSCMTGSGSAVFGVFDSMEHARSAADFMREIYPNLFICRPV